MRRKTILIILAVTLVLSAGVILYVRGVLRHDYEMRQWHLLESMESRLKSIASAEHTWRLQDCDMNGINDYWTYDVSCLNRMYRQDNSTQVCLVHFIYAMADEAPVDINNKYFFGDSPMVAPLTGKDMLTYGYFCRAMLTDEKGLPYNQNPVGTKKILAANSNKYAFVLYPDVYGESGDTYTFIMNEKEEVYARNMGSEKDKIVLQWPRQEELKGKNAKWWRTSYIPGEK